MAKALVTGASSGIGEAFAHHLANMGYDLIVVARREERLQALADKVNVDVQIVVADLATDEGISHTEDAIRACDDLAFLVNNAGFGVTGHFGETNLNTQLAMLSVHLEATLRLTHAAIPQMKANKNGAIINVSSIGSFIPLPASSNYNATKAYLNSFSEALAFELREHGIVVQALCPGFTRTEIFEHGDNDPSDIPAFLWMTSDEVVTISLKAVAQKRVIVTPGWHNQIARRVVQIPIFRKIVQRYTSNLLQ